MKGDRIPWNFTSLQRRTKKTAPVWHITRVFFIFIVFIHYVILKNVLWQIILEIYRDCHYVENYSNYHYWVFLRALLRALLLFFFLRFRFSLRCLIIYCCNYNFPIRCVFLIKENQTFSRFSDIFLVTLVLFNNEINCNF